MLRIGCLVPRFQRVRGRGAVDLYELPGELERSDRLAQVVTEIIDQRATMFAPLLREHPLPPLYRSGIRYAAEQTVPGLDEEFADPWTTFRRKRGDCDDLCIYLLSEWKAQGIPCRCSCEWLDDALHVQVRDLRTGRIEDPSVRLGAR